MNRLLADRYARTATLTASSTLAGSSTANLTDDRLLTAWSANAAGTQTLTIDSGSAVVADGVALLHTNLATAGAIVTASTSADNVTYTPSLTYDQLIADTSRNLLPDPMVSADGGASAFWDYNAGSSYSSTGGYNDNGPCLLLPAQTALNSNVLEDAKTINHPCVAGDRVVVGARIKLSSNFSTTGATLIGVTWHNAAGAEVSAVNLYVNKGLLDQWQLLSAAISAPANAVFYRYRTLINAAVGATGSMLVDNCFLSVVNDPAYINADESVGVAALSDTGLYLPLPTTAVRYRKLSIVTSSVKPVAGTLCLNSTLTLPRPLRPTQYEIDVRQVTAKDSSGEAYCYNRQPYDGFTHRLTYRRLTPEQLASLETLHRRDAGGMRSIFAWQDHNGLVHPVRFADNKLTPVEDGLGRYRVDVTFLEERLRL